MIKPNDSIDKIITFMKKPDLKHCFENAFLIKQFLLSEDQNAKEILTTVICAKRVLEYMTKEEYAALITSKKQNEILSTLRHFSVFADYLEFLLPEHEFVKSIVEIDRRLNLYKKCKSHYMWQYDNHGIKIDVTPQDSIEYAINIELEKHLQERKEKMDGSPYAIILLLSGFMLKKLQTYFAIYEFDYPIMKDYFDVCTYNIEFKQSFEILQKDIDDANNVNLRLFLNQKTPD